MYCSSASSLLSSSLFASSSFCPFLDQEIESLWRNSIRLDRQTWQLEVDIQRLMAREEQRDRQHAISLQQQQQSQINSDNNDDFHGHYATIEQTFFIDNSNKQHLKLVPCETKATSHSFIAADQHNGSSFDWPISVTQRKSKVVVSVKKLSKQRKKKKAKGHQQRGSSAFSVSEKKSATLQRDIPKASALHRSPKRCTSNKFNRNVHLFTVSTSCKSSSNFSRVCVHASGSRLCWRRVKFKPSCCSIHSSFSRVVRQRRHVFAHLQRFHNHHRQSTHHIHRWHRLHWRSHLHTHNRSPSFYYHQQRTHTHHHQLHPYSHTHTVGKFDMHGTASQSSSSRVEFKQRSLGSCKVGPAAFVQRYRASVLRSFQWWRHRIKNHPSTFALIISHSGIKHKRHHITLVIAFFIHSKGNQKLGGKL